MDTKKVASTALTRPFDGSGQRFLLGDAWIGDIDEVRLWNRMLADDEVLALP